MTAREAFKDWGFKETMRWSTQFIAYEKEIKDGIIEVVFDLDLRTFNVCKKTDLIYSQEIDVNLFKAISLQLTELRWI